MSDARNVVLRRPTLADAEAIASIHNDGWRDTYGALLPERFYDQHALQQRVQTWKGALSRSPLAERLYVAEQDGTVVGFAFASGARGEKPPRDLELHMIYVRTSEHGTGAGQALIEAVLKDDAALLWCARDNARALAFYRRNGFKPDDAQKIDPDAPELVEIRLVR